MGGDKRMIEIICYDGKDNNLKRDREKEIERLNEKMNPCSSFFLSSFFFLLDGTSF